jgi:hypothetical protein
MRVRPQAARRISAQCRIQPTTRQRISAGQVRFCQGCPDQQTTTNAPYEFALYYDV